jgi:dipeptidyl-peptidase-3
MKNKIIVTIMATMIALSFSGCGNRSEKKQNAANDSTAKFKFLVEQFADVKVMRYQIPGFDSLKLNQKKLLYYLSQAALCGRDIIFDQNFKFNLAIRRTLEAIVDGYKGDKNSDNWKNFMVYTKRVWFSNGIHHHYSGDKFLPEFTKEYFKELVAGSANAKFPVEKGETVDQLIEKLIPIIFDPKIYSKRIDLNPKSDLITSSACNFYEGVTQKEVEKFYDGMKKKNDPTPVSYGLNSKVVKENGKIVEKVWKTDGMYGKALTEIVKWLEKALTVAENDQQKLTINKLIEFYKTGNLKTWDEYNIEWVKDQKSSVDFVNGFIEVYGDPMGLKATWESVINFKDIEGTKRAEAISNIAQWFEDNSPVDPKFKKKTVKGVSAKVITVVQLGGECYPTTPIGINLPNANWIRKDYGSKSVTMDNITYAYDKAALGSGLLEEFCYSKEEIELSEKYGSIASNLTIDLHECVGHGSGQMLPGISDDALKNYHSALEEARADLFALYFIFDQKMIDIGVMPSLDVAKAEYNTYIRNGLMTQLTRIELGKNIEQSHMRDRQLISKWVYEKGKQENVIEFKKKENKTFIIINDYNKLRNLFGELLKETQRIKSEGDYKSGMDLVEKYGVKVDIELHKEIKTRYAKLKLAPYGGFMNPILVPVMKGNEMIDVKVEYPDDYTRQMMDYSKKYSFLPNSN